MKYLSNATAKGRINTAGCRLAVFFLACLCFFTACPLNATGSDSRLMPYVTGTKLYSFNPDAEQADSITNYSFFNMADGFTQFGTAASKKKGFILAWNKKKQKLCHITGKKIASSVDLKGSLAYAGSDYILVQNSSFADNKGFSFKLYSIKYTWNRTKIKLNSVWTGHADCFVSDFFFTKDGICIAGGTKDDTKHNVFYITDKGIHKCFSMEKDSDFLRLIKAEASQKVFAFVSTRDKAERPPVIYSFNMEDTPDQAAEINLSGDSLLPSGFDCFFGYGFPDTTSAAPDVSTAVPDTTSAVPEHVEGVNLILPACIDGIISFLCYDCSAGKIARIVPNATGCLAALGSTDDGTYYIARDPLIEGSFYGISLFTGTECKKISKNF